MTVSTHRIRTGSVANENSNQLTVAKLVVGIILAGAVAMIGAEVINLVNDAKASIAHREKMLEKITDPSSLSDFGVDTTSSQSRSLSR